MPIDPLSNVSQLIEALRRQVSSAQETAAAGQIARHGGATASKMQTGSTQGAVRRRDIKSLERKLQSRIAKLSENGPQPLESQVRVFVEGVLLWEFGHGLGTSSGFDQMLDSIVSQICDDQVLSSKFDRLFGGSIKQPTGSS